VGKVKADVVEVRLTDRDKTMDRVRAVLAKVDREKPDPKALDELRTILREAPLLARVLCDIAAINADKVIDTLVSGTVGREALSAHTRVMRDGLGYQDAPELERGLIEHVVLCWLRVQKIEYGYTQFMAQASVVLSQADWWERRLTAAQVRYLRACEGLARVRRLTRPGQSALQVNIGGQQVNVAGGVAGDGERDDAAAFSQ
jgi:hypothetical protein